MHFLTRSIGGGLYTPPDIFEVVYFGTHGTDISVGGSIVE